MPAELNIHIDVFALLIFLGVIQGFFLSSFFFLKKSRQKPSNIYLGLLLICCSLLSLDILVSYTNYMFYMLWFVDLTEPLTLIIGPLFYLYLKSKISGKHQKTFWLHFIPSGIYLFYHVPFMIQGNNYKYNAYIFSYHPELSYRPYTLLYDVDPLGIKSQIVLLLLLSMGIYAALSEFKSYSYFRQQKDKTSRGIFFESLVFSVVVITVFAVRLTAKLDLGDYIIMSVIALVIYLISFRVVLNSSIFSQNEKKEKYSRSSLTSEYKQKLLVKIRTVMESEEYFLKPNSSLPELAKLVGSNPNHVSQTINEQLSMSFFDLLAEYRINKAKILLISPEHSDRTIEEIAYTVGYNSKSTFNTAFKKLTGLTPSEYKIRNSQ